MQVVRLYKQIKLRVGHAVCVQGTPAQFGYRLRTTSMVMTRAPYSGSAHCCHEHKHKHDKWSECWKCGTQNQSESLFCDAPKCGVVQVISQDTNLFDTLDIEMGYFINENALETAYKNLQKKLHPDKFATKPLDEKAKSTENSSAINYAYETLKSPLHRAEYMVWLVFNKNVLDERTVSDSKLMLEMFELQEQLEETVDQISLNTMKLSVDSAFAALQNEFNNAITAKDEPLAINTVTKMRYYSKIMDEIAHRRDV